MNPLRLSHLERYRAEQRGYVERGLAASYAYAKRVIDGMEGDALSDEAFAALNALRAAMSNGEPIAACLFRLFVCVPYPFRPEHAQRTSIEAET